MMKRKRKRRKRKNKLMKLTFWIWMRDHLNQLPLVIYLIRIQTLLTLTTFLIWGVPSLFHQVNQIYNRNSIAFSTWAMLHLNRLLNSNRNSWEFPVSTLVPLDKHGCKCRIHKLKINSQYHALLPSLKA